MRPILYGAPAQKQNFIPWDDVAPVRGMDNTVPIHNMPSGVAVFLYNILPSEYGCRTRLGTRVWAEDLAGGSVNTVIPFTGQLGDFSLSRLFACTQNGVYDVTTQGTLNPTPVVTFPDQSAAAGFGSFIHFTNPNGEQSLLLADSRNGLYEYTPTGSVWTKYTNEINFPDSTTANDISFVTIHKGRIWLVARDNADAYYLPVGSKNGQATKFQFGSKMRRGGYLVGLWDWSHDGGNGLDDYLIAVGKGGDVLVYQGTDPASSNTWAMVGRWFIGRPPEGRRVAIDVGGDTLLLSIYGVTSATALMAGVDPTRVERNVSGKITRLVREAILEKSDSPFWQIGVLPGESTLVINTPKGIGERNIQFALNLNRVSEDQEGGWGLWRDVPATHFTSYDKQIFYGTEDGKVGIMQGSLDGVDINGANGLPVAFSGLTRFSNLEHPGLYKQVQFLRPRFITSNVISVAATPVYDYDLEEKSLLPVIGGASTARWDNALWDRALWSGTFSVAVLSGGRGYGEKAAMYFQGETYSRATLASYSGAFTPWAFL